MIERNFFKFSSSRLLSRIAALYSFVHQGNFLCWLSFSSGVHRHATSFSLNENCSTNAFDGEAKSKGRSPRIEWYWCQSAFLKFHLGDVVLAVFDDASFNSQRLAHGHFLFVFEAT